MEKKFIVIPSEFGCIVVQFDEYNNENQPIITKENMYNAASTRLEDFEFWQALEGKVINTNIFEIVCDGWQPSYNDPDNIGCLPSGEPLAIPR